MSTAATSGSGQAGRSAELRWRSKKKVLLGLIFVAGGLLLAGGLYTVKGQIAADQALIYYIVKRADLPITVTERGNVESQKQEKINCEVDDIAGDNFKGTQVQFGIPARCDRMS